jgi:hypothetical protein
VVCSTFTRGAKPATRRVADGERMNPWGKGGAFAPHAGDDEHQGDEDLENFPASGAAAPRTACMAPVAPLFHPLPSYAMRQDLPRTSAGGAPPPRVRAINVPLAPVTSGLSRPVMDTPPRRSGSMNESPSRSDSQADSPEGGPATPPPLGI